MVRISLITATLLLTFVSCAHFEQRAARYDATLCPICQGSSTCTYCEGSKKCMYCGGEKERLNVIPNRTGPGINHTSYKTACPYCKHTGTCSYCNQTGKCWACKGTGRVTENWDFLNTRSQSADAASH